jgi:hypothetical protein
MPNGNGVTLESVSAEVEKLGSIIRGLSTQIAGIRVRLSDIEQWDRALMMAGRGKGKAKRKKKAKAKKKAKGKDNGNSNGNGYKKG